MTDDMAAATDVGLVDDLDIDDFDVTQALDLDLQADDDRESRGGGRAYYSAIFSDADIVSHCRHGCDADVDGGAAPAGGWLLAGLVGDDDDDCGDGAEEEEEEEEEEAGSSSSSPADSGVTDGPLAPAAGDAAAAEAMSAYVAELERFLLEEDDGAPCGEQAEVLHGGVHDYFAGDQILATAEVVVVPAAGGAGRTDAEGEEENGDVLAARGDEQSASRKRARNKTPWGELKVKNLTIMDLAQIQVPAAAPWPPALLCCM